MVDKKIRVDLVPLVKISWHDGKEHTFTAEDLEQFVYTLIIEGLLTMALPGQDKVLSLMELELVHDSEGSMCIRPSGLSNR